MPALVMPGRLPLLFLLVTLPAFRPVSAQVIEGTLLGAETRTPISMGTVALLDTLMTELRQVTTDERGRFRLEAPGPGHYYILADALGYKRTLDGVLEMGEAGEVSVDFFLRPEPIEMESISVEAERQQIVQHLETQGFYEREASGFGHFLTPEEIEKRNYLEFGSMFRGFPNLEVIGAGSGHTILRVRFMGNWCPPAVYVDGILVHLRWDDWISPYNPRLGALEEVVGIGDIASVEYYNGPAGLPLRWGGTSINNTCGVIVFWTKGG